MFHDSDITPGEGEELINWDDFAEARRALGEHLVRLLSYFREDGIKSVAAIEAAIHHGSSAELVIPAHTLKGESAQFGAERLSLLAEEIELTARQFVELHQDPGELVEQVARLRPLFEESLSALEAEASPLMQRRPIGFAQRGSFGNRRS